MSDTFKTIIPADLIKANDGKWRIRGLASTSSPDRQNETILQEGISLKAVDQNKSWLNFDHQNDPANKIGKVTGYQKTKDGLVIEGELFKNHKKAQDIYGIMSSLEEGDTGRVGLSVEGVIKKRNIFDPKIIEAVEVSNVAVTFTPVNTDTYVNLMKSMSGAEFDFKPQEKEDSMNVEQVAALIKALGFTPNLAAAPEVRVGVDALAPESLQSKKKKKLTMMTKPMMQKALPMILEKITTLYPEHSKEEIWEVIKERLSTNYTSI